MNQTNWDNKPQVKKGNYGEELVDKFLESKGFICYFPKTKGAHWFDRLAIKDKSRVVIAESKCKSRRTKFPDTGFNYSHYLEYKRIYETHKIPVFVFFIDEYLHKIYGNFLEKLEEPLETRLKSWPSIETSKWGDKIIYFPLKNTVNIAEISSKDSEYLKKNSTRKYDYTVTKG